MSIPALRTPEDRFADLPDFPWAPSYRSDLPVAQGLRLAWLDEGPKDAEHTFLCLHGEPTWSFLYRKMIPSFQAAGGRVVAPDFFGFGQSDKPTEWDTYTFDFHRRTVLELVDALDLDRITLVCQDWGGLIGLTLPLDLGRRISRLIVMNTTLAVGESPGKGFESWKAYVASRPDFDVSGLMARSVPGITPGELSAYDAPFPDATYKIGVRTFPQIVPVRPDMPGAEISHAAAQWWSTEWDGPTFMAVGLQDPVLGGPVMQRLQQVIRGCPPPLELPDAGHFAQEAGDVVAEAALAAFGG